MRKTLKWIAVILLLCSISLALYPTLSKSVTQKECDNKAKTFDKITKEYKEGNFKEALDKGVINEEGYPTDLADELPVLFKEDVERMLNDSRVYNNQIKDKQNIYHSSDFEYSALYLPDYGIHNGMYGYLSAESINLTLPIYLGATEGNMRVGATHLYMTSLPIGGIGTNCVLAGHTGYFGKTFFDNIGNLNVGDEIAIENYFGTLKYQVSELKNVESYDIEDVYIDENKDLVTLVTCSNGGTTRLLVICERKD